MFDDLRTYLNSKIELTDQDFQLIFSHCLAKKLRRRQYLLQAGDIWKFNVFVGKGLLKLYYLDDKGQEHILQFVPENHWTGDRESMTNELPSKYFIDAIEETEVTLIPRDDFEMLRKQIPAFDNFVDQALKKNVQALQERIHVSISYTAEEKYHAFINQFPDIANRVPLHMIASYLGISAETLSRIRSQAGRK